MPDNDQYIGKPGFDANQFKQKIASGNLLGIVQIESSESGNDIIDGGDDNDLNFGQQGDDLLIGNTGDDVNYDTSGNNQLYDGNDPLITDPTGASSIMSQLDNEGQWVIAEFANNDYNKTAFKGAISSGLQGSQAGMAVDISDLQYHRLDLVAGQEIILTSTNWPGNGNPYWNGYCS